MALLEEYIAREMEELRAQGVTVRFLGDLDRLSEASRASVRRLEGATTDGSRAGAQHLPLLQLAGRDHAGGAAAGRRGGGRPPGARRRDRGSARRAALHRRLARSRPADPDLRRAPALELPPLAAGVRRVPRHAGPLARLHPPSISSRPSSTSSAANVASDESPPEHEPQHGATDRLRRRCHPGGARRRLARRLGARCPGRRRGRPRHP